MLQGESQHDRALHFLRTGKLDQAESILKRLAAKPGASAAVLADLATLLHRRRQTAQAEQFALIALSRATSADDFHGVGLAYDAMGRRVESAGAFRKAISLDNAHGAAWNGLGLQLTRDGDVDGAIAALERARTLRPNDTIVQCNLFWAWSLGWRLDEAIDSLRNLVQRQPADLEAHKLLGFLLSYTDRTTPQEVLDVHRAMGRLYKELAAGVSLPPLTRRDTSSRPLCVGLLSPDLRDHPVARFVEPLLMAHDQARFTLHAYSLTGHEDAVSASLRTRADSWTSLSGLSELEACRRIRQDDLDVLVDLAGHTSGAKVGILVLRAAPTQITYLGYPGTTGLSEVDFRVVDSITDPPGAEAFATETLLRLDPCFLCFSPSAPARGIPSRPPSRPDAPITFGSFNTLRKLTPRVAQSWARIVLGVPGSRLLLKNSGVGSAEVARRVLAHFESLGVPHDRVEVLGRMADAEDHFRCYHRVDIALDTVPYNGTTTTCEALWMGVPVVTMLGERHVSRVSASLLRAVDATELVAKDPGEYEARAMALAGDTARRHFYHASLRARMERGVLCDAGAFAARFEAALRSAHGE